MKVNKRFIWYRDFFYSQSNEFENSIHSLSDRFGDVISAEYIGDLDFKGLNIMNGAFEVIKYAHPNVEAQPAEILYVRLLNLYLNNELLIKYDSNPTVYDLSSFSGTVSKTIELVFEKNKRIPQELMNFCELHDLFQVKIIGSRNKNSLEIYTI